MYIQSSIFHIKTIPKEKELVENILSVYFLTEEEIDPRLNFHLRAPEGKNSIGIKQISELINWNSTKNNKYKFGIIYEAENLTIQAQNSMLKTLEEPTLKTGIILLTKNPAKLLGTIRSRCQVIRLANKHRNENTSISQYLKSDFNKRESFIKEVINKQGNPRQQLNEFIEDLLSYMDRNVNELYNNSEYNNMVELIQISNQAIERNVNIKLVTTNLNINMPII